MIHQLASYNCLENEIKVGCGLAHLHEIMKGCVPRATLHLLYKNCITMSKIML